MVANFRSSSISIGGLLSEALFDHLGPPSFFDEAVDQILGRIAARVESEHPPANSGTMRYAPQESWAREVVICESRRMKREIEDRCVKSGKLELPESCKSEQRET